MNQCVTGWKYFSTPRMFEGYGRQKGWERESPATGFDNGPEKTPDGFVPVNEQMKLRKNPAKDALGDNGEPAKENSISGQLIYKDYGDGYRFHVSTPKTEAGIRVIPMSDMVYKAFLAQKRQNFLQRIPRNVEIEGRTDFIFMSRNGRPLMSSAVNNVLYNIVAAYNKGESEQARREMREPETLPSISAHTLRHTACTRMAEQGLDMKIVQYIMGHANISVTVEVYNHITERARIENEIAKMDRAQVV